MTLKSIRNTLMAASAFGLLATAAYATPSGDLLVSQPPIAGGSTTSSDSGLGALAADDFSFAGFAHKVSGVVWYGNNLIDPAAGDSFTVSFYASSALSSVFSTSSVSVTRTDAGFVDTDGFEVFKYEADFTGPVLDPSTVYAISIVNDLNYDSTGDVWLWLGGAPDVIGDGSGFADSTTGGVFLSNPDLGGLAFSIYGTPEPASLALLGSGVLLLARRRRAK